MSDNRVTGWIMAGCGVLALALSWGAEQGALCANGWPFPFCIKNPAARSEDQAARPDHAPGSPTAPADTSDSPLAGTLTPKPLSMSALSVDGCGDVVELKTVEAVVYSRLAGERALSVEVSFMVREDGTATLLRVDGGDAEQAAEAAEWVRSQSWSPRPRPNCGTCYFVRQRIVFAKSWVSGEASNESVDHTGFEPDTALLDGASAPRSDAASPTEAEGLGDEN